MKVLFVTTLYPSKSFPQGGLFVKELALALRKQGVDLRVLHLSSFLPWPLNRLKRYRQGWDNAADEDASWLSFQRIPILPGAIGSTMIARFLRTSIARRLKTIWPDFVPDVVHAQTFITGGMMGHRVAEEYNRPLVITSHGADTRVFIHRARHRWVILDLCKRSKLIICVGRGIRDSLVENGASPDNIKVLNNGMDLGKVHSGSNPRACEFEGKRVIVGVGNLKFTKGFDLFIEAIDRLRSQYPDIHGVIVGGGDEEGRLREMIRRRNLDAFVSMSGAQTPAETMAYMDCGEIFCLPSWSEGFGIVYLEAMAHGKPVIAVEGQGIADVVRNNQTGILVKPRDAACVADAIRTLLDNPQMAREMGSRGRELVYNDFSWDKNAQQLLELYRAAIDSHR